MKALPALLILLQCGLLLGGATLAGRPAYRWSLRRYAHMRARADWLLHARESGGGTTLGQPALWLSIPSCGFDDLVLADDSTANLARHACLVRGTPPVILGHRDTHFRALRGIAVNDPVLVRQPDGRRTRYRVTEIEVLPADRANRRLHEHRDPASLVLMTCHPFRYIGPAPNRLIVWTRAEGGAA